MNPLPATQDGNSSHPAAMIVNTLPAIGGSPGEESIRQAMDATSDGVWDWDISTDEGYFSPAYYRMLGYEPNAFPLSGKRWADFIHPNDRQRVLSAKLDCVENRCDKYRVEFRMKARDGSWKWILGRGRASQRDALGRTLRMIGTHVDITERKQAEEALRASEEKFRCFFENVQDVIYEVTLDGSVLDISPSIEHVTKGQYRREDIIGRPIIDFYAKPQEREIFLEALQVEGSVTDYEIHFKNRDGTVIPCSVSSKLQRDAEGKPWKIIGSIRDITERKRLEAVIEKRLVALTQPLDQPEGITFEQLFDLADIQRLQDQFAIATGVGSLITHPDGTPITRPSNFCRLCDKIIRCTEKGRLNCYRSDALLGRHHPDGPAIQPCLSGGLWDAGASITVGDRHLANWLIGQVRNETQTDDKMREYARTIGADEEAVIEAFHEIPAMSLARFTQIAQALFTLANQLSSTAYQNVQQARFIAERKRAEDALQANETKHRAMVANISDVIAIIDQDGVNRYKSPNIEKWFGWRPEEVVGLPTWNNVHPDDLSHARQCFDKVSKEPNATEMSKCRYRCKNGTYKWVECTAVNLIHDPEIRGILLNYKDITERARADEEREKLQTQLTQAQKMESVGRLAGGVAHDFNNMLTVIQGNVALAMESLPPDSPVRENLEEALKCAQRSADLTRQLLAFARKQTVIPKLLDLNATMEGMLKMLRRLIGEDINLIWAPGASLWPIKIDPSQIDQILANLCVNARDAISGMGKLTLETANAVFDKVYCDTHTGFIPGEYVVLAVTDDGCGMDKHVLGHLFEPFFTTKAVGKGTGLGLATVYGIVKQNNGFIDVQSEPGLGTTFKIYLPRHAGKTAGSLPGPDQSHNGGHETILVVEDESAILNLVRRTLQHRGYTLLAAATPGEAIRMAGEHPGDIHLLMTDVVMPEMNGRDLARRILTLYPNIKRLFMSGYAADFIAHHGILDEGIRFLQKPFTVDALSKKIREALETP